MRSLRFCSTFLSAPSCSLGRRKLAETNCPRFGVSRESVMCETPPVRRSSRLVTKSTSGKEPKKKGAAKVTQPRSVKKSLPKVMPVSTDSPAAGGGCSWPTATPDYQAYHDYEWGTPLYDDQKMFEFLILETFQAGLNWLLILRKRENFKAAFHGFDVDRISEMTDEDVERLLKDAGIVRHEGKIRAAIGNARVVQGMRDVERIGLTDYFWRWVDYKPVVNESGVFITRNKLSDKIAKDMKKRGFKFIGSTTMYSHLQACGIANDHHPSCPRYTEVQRLVIPRSEFGPNCLVGPVGTRETIADF